MTTNTSIAKHEQDLPVKVKVLKHHGHHRVGEDEHLEGQTYLGRVRVRRSRSKKRKQLWVFFIRQIWSLIKGALLNQIRVFF